MEKIDMLLYQYITQVIEWLFNVSWYWLPALIGFSFRTHLLKCKIYNPKMRARTTIRDIGIVYVLTILWSNMTTMEMEANAAIMIVILTMIYVFYGLAKSCEDTGGTTDSLLHCIKSTFVTILSFQTMWATVFFALFTCIIAMLAYKWLYKSEKKTDLFEIFFLCIEAVILSIYVEVRDVEGIGILLFVFFVETAIFLMNYIVKDTASVFLGEAENMYY